MDSDLSAKEFNSKPSLIILYILVISIIIPFGLMIIQSTEFSIMYSPNFLKSMIHLIPGPSAKIHSLNANGYYESALKYEFYISVQIALLISTLSISISYVFIKNVKPYEFNPGDKLLFSHRSIKSKNSIITGLLFILSSSYFLFFSTFIDYRSDRIFFPNNIHESVIGYNRDIFFSLIIFISVTAMCMFTNRKFRGETNTNGAIL